MGRRRTGTVEPRPRDGNSRDRCTGSTSTATAKNETIDAVAEIQRAGSDDEMFPNTRPESDDEISEYTHAHIRPTRIENAKEFPVDLSMLQEVLFALVLPYFASKLLDSAMTGVSG